MKITQLFLCSVLAAGPLLWANAPAPSTAPVELSKSSAEKWPVVKNPQEFFMATGNVPARLTITPATYLIIGPGIRIDCTTGRVTIPAGMSLDDASRKFWLALAESYTPVREAWIAGYRAGKGGNGP